MPLMSGTRVKYPPGQEMELDSLRQNIRYCRQSKWAPAAWEPGLVLRNKKNGTRLTVWERAYDHTVFELIAAGDHDHCGICWLTFSKAECHLQHGYFNGEGWLCTTCHRLFIDTTDPEPALTKLERVS